MVSGGILAEKAVGGRTTELLILYTVEFREGRWGPWGGGAEVFYFMVGGPITTAEPGMGKHSLDCLIVTVIITFTVTSLETIVTYATFSILLVMK
jgi:hypothetical protein